MDKGRPQQDGRRKEGNVVVRVHGAPLRRPMSTERPQAHTLIVMANSFGSNFVAENPPSHVPCSRSYQPLPESPLPR